MDPPKTSGFWILDPSFRHFQGPCWLTRLETTSLLVRVLLGDVEVGAVMWAK